MTESGITIENPVTRERLTWLKTASETDGKLLRFELFVRPGGESRLPLVHPRQSKRIEVVSGSMRHLIGKEKKDTCAGEFEFIAPGESHEWWNPGDEEVRAVVEYRPALNTEAFIESLWSFAREERKTAGDGVPNMLRLAVWLTGTFEDEVYLRKTPIPAQKSLFAILAPIGKMLGYRDVHTGDSVPKEIPDPALEGLAP